MRSEDPRLYRRMPLASGSAPVAIVVLLSAVRFFHHSPLPDAPPGNIRKQLDAIAPGLTVARDGVHIAIPRGWEFRRYAQSRQLQSPTMMVPGLGRVRIDTPRSVVFAAGRRPGFCAAILERDTISQMDLDEDARTIKRTVAQNVYERNVFDWFHVFSGERFGLLVDAADEMLRSPEAAKRTMSFRLVTDAATRIGGQPARALAFAANLNGRERAGLSYVVAHKDRWQYVLIGTVGEPPRLCTTEITWIQEHLSFD